MNLEYIQSFTNDYTEFRIQPLHNDVIILKGRITQSLNHEVHGEVLIDYTLTIHVPENYPNELPIVFEESGHIKNNPSNHINYDGSLCLGSPIRLILVLKRNPSLTDFFERCILPYLYAVTIKNTTDKGFVFGELSHGDRGLLDDFKSFFHLKEDRQVYHMLKILSTTKKHANKSICPCGCKKRVTLCSYFKKVLQMRSLLSRLEWEEQLKLIK